MPGNIILSLLITCLLLESVVSTSSVSSKLTYVTRRSKSEDVSTTLKKRHHQEPRWKPTDELPIRRPPPPEASSEEDYDEYDDFEPDEKPPTKECSFTSHHRLKEHLLASFRVSAPQPGENSYLLSIMFSHFDRNNNGELEEKEVERIGDPDEVNLNCGFLRFDDSDSDGRLSLDEFISAFAGFKSTSLQAPLPLQRITALAGDNVELKCDLHHGVWTRFGSPLAPLSDGEVLRIFPDSDILYLNKVEPYNAGNYSCHPKGSDSPIQTHILTVQTLPQVQVTPKIAFQQPGKDARIQCRVSGWPPPSITWLKNEEPLPADEDRYEMGESVLIIRNLEIADTGAYYCKGVNPAGRAVAISSLVILDQDPHIIKSDGNETFLVFHERGISVYDPDSCGIKHQILGSDFIPGTQESLCGGGGGSRGNSDFAERADFKPSRKCRWGRSVKASNSIYVSQPELDRLLVISIPGFIVVDVIGTDSIPVELYYLPHLDQVWIQCWRDSSSSSGSLKSLQVIQRASQKTRHHTTLHLMEPFEGRKNFDTSVSSLFLPSSSDSPQFTHGYVAHKNSRSLYKLDLAALTFTKFIDLTPYNCSPLQIQFSPIFGSIIIQCEEPLTHRPKGLLILDYLTDSVVGHQESLIGEPHLTPDGGALVTLTHLPQGSLLNVQHATENGLTFAFEVKTSLNLSGLSFFPSSTRQGYDLYATSTKDNVLFLDLDSGQVEMIQGVSGLRVHPGPTPRPPPPWVNPISRPISTRPGPFPTFLTTPSTSPGSLYILNGLSRTVHCQISGHFSSAGNIMWL